MTRKLIEQATTHVIETLVELHAELQNPNGKAEIHEHDLVRRLKGNNPFSKYVAKQSQTAPPNEEEEAGIDELEELIRQANERLAKDRGTLAFTGGSEKTRADIQKGFLIRSVLDEIWGKLKEKRRIGYRTKPQRKIIISDKQATDLKHLIIIRRLMFKRPK